MNIDFKMLTEKALKSNLLAPSGALRVGFAKALESLGTTCGLANKLGKTLRQL